MTEYRIDELARAAGTTTRNVRAYQGRKLLPPPVKRGRTGIYDESHLARLQLIDSLLQRGFTTAHIADFITSWESGKDLAEVLGLQNAVTASWSTDDTLEVPLELVSLFLGTDERDVLDKLVDQDLARLEGDTVVFTDRELLESFAVLHGYGFELQKLIDLHSEIAEQMDTIAHRMIDHAKQHLVDEHGEGWLPDTHDEITQTTDMLNRMRDIGTKSVQRTLTHALERNLQHVLGDYLAAAARRSGNTP